MKRTVSRCRGRPERSRSVRTGVKWHRGPSSSGSRSTPRPPPKKTTVTRADLDISPSTRSGHSVGNRPRHFPIYEEWTLGGEPTSIFPCLRGRDTRRGTDLDISPPVRSGYSTENRPGHFPTCEERTLGGEPTSTFPHLRVVDTRRRTGLDPETPVLGRPPSQGRSDLQTHDEKWTGVRG